MLLDGSSKALEWRTNLKNQKLIAENQHFTNAFFFLQKCCTESGIRIRGKCKEEWKSVILTNVQVWPKEQRTALSSIQIPSDELFSFSFFLVTICWVFWFWFWFFFFFQCQNQLCAWLHQLLGPNPTILTNNKNITSNRIWTSPLV